MENNKEGEKMKLWVVLEASNIDSDIFISDPFYSEEQAQKHLIKRYEEYVSELDEDKIDLVRHTNNAYSILTYGSDYYYGVVHSINVDKYVVEPGDKIYCVQELKL
jgi:ABC-type Fe3+ transport system substrate-binding protein